jgi:hypothetical protein
MLQIALLCSFNGRLHRCVDRTYIQGKPNTAAIKLTPTSSDRWDSASSCRWCLDLHKTAPLLNQRTEQNRYFLLGKVHIFLSETHTIASEQSFSNGVCVFHRDIHKVIHIEGSRAVVCRTSGKCRHLRTKQDTKLLSPDIEAPLLASIDGNCKLSIPGTLPYSPPETISVSTRRPR